MVRIVALTFFIILGLLVVGCSSKGTTKMATRGDTLDVSPSPKSLPVPAAEPVTAPQPVFDEPMVQTQPPAPVKPIAMVTAAPAPAKSPAAGSTYTVKKGDTLTSIARKQYGTGDWKRIAAANPGLQPNNIKAGQKIIVP